MIFIRRKPNTFTNSTIEKIRFAIVFLLACTYAHSQENYFDFYQLDINNGLANNTVYELMQDDYGFIWIGSGSTVQRYDGSRFLNFERSENQPIPVPEGEIRSIFKDSQGFYWIGSDGGGVVRFKDGKYNHYINDGTAGCLSNNVVEHLIELPDSSIYIATWGGGINVYKNGKFTQLRHNPDDENSLPNDNIIDLYYDRQDDKIWIGTWDGGLCYLKDGKVHRFSISPEGFNAPRARTIKQTEDGTIWIGSWGDGLFSYANGKFKQYNVASGDLQNNNVLTLSTFGNTLWIGTWGGGVTLMENSRFTTFRHEVNHTNTICSDYVESTLVDRDGNLWIGTFGGGISRFQKSQFHFFPELSQGNVNPNSRFVKNIAEDAQGRIWLAGEPGLFIEENGNFRLLSDVYPGLPQIQLSYCLALDHQGHMWIGGGSGVGLFEFDGKQIHDRSLLGDVDFRKYFIHDIMSASDGSIWISGEMNAGLIRIKDGKVERFFHDPENDQSVSCNSFYNTMEASDGTIWISTSKNGLSTFKNGKFKNYRYNPLDSTSISSDYINSMIETSSGEIWLATLKGLCKYNNKLDNFKTFHLTNSQGQSNILSLIEDQNHDLWMGTDIGVAKFDLKTHAHQNYDHSSGIEGHPFYMNAIHKSSATNYIYIGGFNGLVAFHPDSLYQRTNSDPIKITNVLMNNRALKTAEKVYKNHEKLYIESYEGSLLFEFSEFNYNFGGPTQYAYRLKNLDDNWINAGQNTSALFSYIPAGNYIFQVRSSADGQTWSSPTNLEIIILPKFWETWWFKIIIGILVLGLIPLFFIIRLNFLEKQKVKLQKLVEDKTQEIVQKTDQITQNAEALYSANAKLKLALFQLQELDDQRIIFQENERQAISRELHDSISTTLFGIRMMIASHKQESTEDFLKVPAQVDAMLEQVIRDSQIILNNLSTSVSKHTSFYDSLNDLVNQSKLISSATINLLWKGEDHIDELRLAASIFRIIQSALSNCIKHSNAKNINIRLINSDSIHCEIEDDGIGFEMNTKEPKPGINRMQKRAEEIDANLTISSAPGEGTLVILEVDKK